MSTIRLSVNGKPRLHNDLRPQAGYSIRWSGQYESMERVRQRLLLRLTGLLIVILLYLNT